MINKNPSIVLTTGGTGGHIFPALAVGFAVQKKYPKVQIIFAGATYGKEEEFAKKAGYEFYGLNVRGFKGRGFKAIGAGFTMLKAILNCYFMLGKLRPQAVLGFGGYACFAMVFAAKLRNIPCIIHEQNAIPGLANKILGKLVDRVCLSLPDENQAFNPKKTTLTGNPIRSEIAKINFEQKEEIKNNSKDFRKHLLIMGGSLGATVINSLAISMLSKLKLFNVKITHQCGSHDYARVKEAYKSHGFSLAEIDAMLFEFIDNMADVYAKCDLALCRAGATSIAELTATATPAIFIPFAKAANDHQSANASNLVQNNAALSFSEDEIKNLEMDKIIFELLADDEKLLEMAKNMYSLAKADAANNVVNVLEKLIAKSLEV